MDPERDEVRALFRTALGTPPPLGFTAESVRDAALAETAAGARDAARIEQAAEERRHAQARLKNFALTAASVVVVAGFVGGVVVDKVRDAGTNVQSTPIPDGSDVPTATPPTGFERAMLDSLGRGVGRAGGSVLSDWTVVSDQRFGTSAEAAAFTRSSAGGVRFVVRDGRSGVLWARISRDPDPGRGSVVPTTRASCATDVWAGAARSCRTVRLAGGPWVRVAVLAGPADPLVWTAGTVVDGRLIEVVLRPDDGEDPPLTPEELVAVVGDLHRLG